MTPEIFDEKLPLLLDYMKRANCDKLNMSFFGGEPMLNFDLIKYATKKIREVLPDTQLVIISNMTMIDEEKSKWIKENNVGVSWSFDGMGSEESRPLLPILENTNKDGEQYDSILKMYEDKKDLILDLTRGCKVMVWSGNMHEMSDNLDFFVDWGIYSPDFSLVRDDVWTKEDIVEFRKHIRDLGDNYISKIKQGIQVSVGFFHLCILDNIMGLSKGKRPFGCFAGSRGAVLTSKGDFYPCARFASKDLMKIDDDYSFSYWYDKFNPKNYDKCQGCDLYNVCNAGCSFSQLRNDNKPVDSVCELFHIIQEETQRIVHELRDNETFYKQITNALKRIG
jgi:uncharacterized protein